MQVLSQARQFLQFAPEVLAAIMSHGLLDRPGRHKGSKRRRGPKSHRERYLQRAGRKAHIRLMIQARRKRQRRNRRRA